MKILFVASEAFPFVKTGGLGDVCGSLPPALKSLGGDVRLLLPAYRDVKARAEKPKVIAQLNLPSVPGLVRLLETRLPGTKVPVWMVDFPPAFDREGHPYNDPYGNAWNDNAARFALLSRAACAIALGQSGIRWTPDIVHCHDWQTGLVPALLSLEPRRPATIFTVHNLAYQGLVPPHMLHALGLPGSFWSYEALEYHGALSFIKGGLVYADRITTVSPTYAREIQTPEFGEGLDGLLRHRANRLRGILNGVDEKVWDPARDKTIPARYSARNLANKRKDKTALQKELGLKKDGNAMVLGWVGRLVHQKGMDLLVNALNQLMSHRIQLAVLGTGEPGIEQALRAQAARYPGQCAVTIGYDEGLAHRIIAGADAFLMPSRFEPCGLAQLYSLRYGTVPIVRYVGGLADTVMDEKTGIVFEPATPQALADAVMRAFTHYRKRTSWQKLIKAGMKQDFSLRHSAKEYLKLYRQVLKKR